MKSNTLSSQYYCVYIKMDDTSSSTGKKMKPECLGTVIHAIMLMMFFEAKTDCKDVIVPL